MNQLEVTNGKGEVVIFNNTYLLDESWVFRDIPYQLIPNPFRTEVHKEGIDFIEFLGMASYHSHTLLKGKLNCFFLRDVTATKLSHEDVALLAIPRKHYLYRPFRKMIYYFKSLQGRNFWLGLSKKWVDISIEYSFKQEISPLISMYLVFDNDD